MPDLQDGGQYEPATDKWYAVTPVGAPLSLYYAVVLWTGTRMIAWGGSNPELEQARWGGLYDPIADDWQPVSPCGAPDQSPWQAGIWTGTKMVLWCLGVEHEPPYYSATGAIYAPP